ncbi:hypothetical protein [Ursidibacter sp. B-7004-1]
MVNVKMTFSVEIDGETIIQHQINEQGKITRSRFHEERKLAKEIIDKMNEFHSERWIDKKPWPVFDTYEKQ